MAPPPPSGDRRGRRRPGASPSRRTSAGGAGRSQGRRGGAPSRRRTLGVRGQAERPGRRTRGGADRASGGSARRGGGAGRGAGRTADGVDGTIPGPSGWGGLARRGAGRVAPGRASEAWRAAAEEARRRRGGERAGRPAPTQASEPEPWVPEQWIDEGELRDEAAAAVGRGRRRAADGARRAGGARPRREGRRAETAASDEGSPRRRAGERTPRPPLEEELERTVPPNWRARFEQRLEEAIEAFRRERFEEARRILRPLAEQAPGATSVRELFGLTLYRLGRWAEARRELEAFRVQSGSTEQHPVLADCYRALGQYAEVEELWDELRAASPSAELVAEGRIVAAGALADQGRLDEAIRLLEAGAKPTRRPKLHHLRMAYALADLYERAGDAPRARELFGRVAEADPDFVDVQARLRALR